MRKVKIGSFSTRHCQVIMKANFRPKPASHANVIGYLLASRHDTICTAQPFEVLLLDYVKGSFEVGF